MEPFSAPPLLDEGLRSKHASQISFCHKVRPIDGESCASWASRTAAENLIGTGQIKALLGAQKGSDVDVWREGVFLQALARTNDTNMMLAVRTVLDCRNGVSRGWCGSSHGTSLATMSLSHQSGRNSDVPRYQFCPLCLAEDVVPHFRIAWRCAFIVACPVHDSQLLDMCPTCCGPILLGAASNNVGSSIKQRFVYCERCGSDLRQSEIRRCPFPALRWQKLLLTALDSGFFTLDGDSYYYAGALLQAVRRVIALFGAASSKRQLLNQAKKVLPGLGLEWSIENRSRPSWMSELSTSARTDLALILDHLFDQWPRNFVQFMRDAGVTAIVSREQCKGGRQASRPGTLPFFLHEVVVSEFGVGRRRYQDAEIDAALEHFVRSQIVRNKNEIKAVTAWRKSAIAAAFARFKSRHGRSIDQALARSVDTREAAVWRLTKRELDLVLMLFPRGGPDPADVRQTLDALLCRQLRATTFTRLPEEFGIAEANLARLSTWRRRGVLDKIINVINYERQGTNRPLLEGGTEIALEIRARGTGPDAVWRLTDVEIAAISNLSLRTRDPRDVRRTFEAMIYRGLTGVPYSRLPAGFPPPESIEARETKWRSSGVLAQALTLLKALRSESGRPFPEIRSITKKQPRRLSVEVWARLISEAWEHGAGPTNVARRNGIDLSMLYRWRKRLAASGRNVAQLNLLPNVE